MIANVTNTIMHYMESYSFSSNPWETVPFETVYENGKNHLFDFKFPWYTNGDDYEESLEEFKRMFILRFYTENIKAETIELFKLRLNARITEEMPYLSELYKSMKFEYDPLINQDYSDTTHDNIKGESEDGTNDDLESEIDTSDTGTSKTSDNKKQHEVLESKSTTNDQKIHSDNPQTNFAGNDYASNMDRGQTVTNGSSDDTITNTDTSNTDTTNKSNIGRKDSRYTKTSRTKEDDRNITFKHEGFTGSSKTDNVLKYREAIININKLLCDMCDGKYPNIFDERHWKSSLFSGYYGAGIGFVV